MIAHLRRVPYDGTPHGTPEPKKPNLSPIDEASSQAQISE